VSRKVVAMNELEKPHPLLQRPLFIYSLPDELLNSLTLKQHAAELVEHAPRPSEEPQALSSAASATGCLTCNISSFPDVSQQREHVRSDLHKFNLKRKVAGQSTFNADEFDKMLEGRPL
jgi:hypothetical protein